MNRCVLDFFSTEPADNVTHVQQASDVNRQLQSFFNKLFVLVFYSRSNEQSLNVCECVHAVSRLQKGVMFHFIEIEQNEEVGDFFQVEVVPSLYFVTAMKKVQTRLDNPDLEGLAERIQQELDLFKENFGVQQERMFPRLKSLISGHPVMVFMKGSPDAPRCGFSKQFVAIMKAHEVKYSHFDILEDQEVREWLKYYSSWKSYPQLYVNQKLVGGLDVVRGMIEEGSFLGLFSGC